MGRKGEAGEGAEKGLRWAHTAGAETAAGAAAGPAAPLPGRKGGGAIADAAADLAAVLQAERAPGAQLDLLGEDEDDGELGALLPAAARERAEARRGRGRPPGAGNKRTELVRDYLLGKGYVHPLERLAQFASYEPAELARAIGCKTHEAAEIIRKAAADLAPYFESKRPTEVAIQSDSRHMIVVGALAAGPAPDGALSIFGAAAKAVEDQRDSAAEAVRPNGEASYGEAQAIDIAGKSGA